jgi:hypothetical protein
MQSSNSYFSESCSDTWNSVLFMVVLIVHVRFFVFCHSSAVPERSLALTAVLIRVYSASVSALQRMEALRSWRQPRHARASVRTAAKRSSRKYIVNMRSSWSKMCSVEAHPDAVAQYTENAQEYLKKLRLPLGAKLVPVDTTTGDWTMQLPALTFMSVLIRYARRLETFRIVVCAGSV